MERIKDISINISNSKITKWVCLMALPLLVLAYYPTEGGDYDIWWHLKLGEHYVKNLTLKIDHSIFSWTPADPGWIYNTWLGSTIFYVAYKAVSGFGLWLVQWSVFTGVFLLCYLYIRSKNETLDISSLSGLLLLAIAWGMKLFYIEFLSIQDMAHTGNR